MGLGDDRRRAWHVPAVGVRSDERARFLREARRQLAPEVYADAWATGALLEPTTAARLVGSGSQGPAEATHGLHLTATTTSC